MADPFTNAIQRLKGTGFFEFLLPFMLTAAIFYRPAEKIADIWIC